MARARHTRLLVRLAQAAVALGVVAGHATAAREPVAAVPPDRQAQIEQHARRLEPQLRPLVQAQLELARATCGSLPAAVRRQVAAAAAAPLRGIADEWAARQFGVADNPQKQQSDPVKVIHEALAAAVAPHVPPAELAAFRQEHAAAIGRRTRAAQKQIVAKLDQRVVLSGSQRAAIEADLEKNWQPDWLVELADAGNHSFNNAPPAADFADRCIAPHLDAPQRAAWKAWSQTSGWSQFRQSPFDVFQSLQLNSTGEPLPPDPWWAP